MIITLNFKTPDVVFNATNGMNIPELDMEVIEKFIDYGELLTVEIDTEAGTATVLPAPLAITGGE